MSSAFKCDRCREFHDGKPALRLDCSGDGPADALKRDICKGCKDSFSAWILQACPVDCARNIDGE